MPVAVLVSTLITWGLHILDGSRPSFSLYFLSCNEKPKQINIAISFIKRLSAEKKINEIEVKF